MTEVCTLVTSTISTATSTRQSEYSSMLLNHVCNTHMYQHLHHLQQLRGWLKLSFCHKGRKEQRFWDGQKAVYVVLLGSTVVLPCINRRNVWTDWSNEEEDQQVCVYNLRQSLIQKDYMILNIITPYLPWRLPGCSLGPSVPRNPPWPCWPAGRSVCIWGAAQLWTSLSSEEDEHQQSRLLQGRLLTYYIWSAGV